MRHSFFALTALCVFSIAAHADTVYTYTGQYFTDATGPYTTSDRVTGSFTVATPLGDNLNNYSFVPESFSFTDGVQTLTQNNSVFLHFFDFSTDANGTITGYRIALAGQSNASEISVENSTYFVGDAGSVPASFNNYSQGDSLTPGSFTTPSSVTPEPSSLTLFGTGLLGIASMVRKCF